MPLFFSFIPGSQATQFIVRFSHDRRPPKSRLSLRLSVSSASLRYPFPLHLCLFCNSLSINTMQNKELNPSSFQSVTQKGEGGCDLKRSSRMNPLDDSRCTQTTAAGRRCKMPRVTSHVPLCGSHLEPQGRRLRSEPAHHAQDLLD